MTCEDCGVPIEPVATLTGHGVVLVPRTGETRCPACQRAAVQAAVVRWGATHREIERRPKLSPFLPAHLAAACAGCGKQTVRYGRFGRPLCEDCGCRRHGLAHCWDWGCR